MSVVCLIYLNVCFRLHVYYLVLALFQFSLLSHYCRMHETVLHGCLPNRRTASPTCMLICFLNPPFMFCMHYLSLLLSLSVAMHFIDLFVFICPSTSWANLGLVSAFTKAALRNFGKEGSPSSPYLRILAQHWPLGLFCAFLEDSGFLAQEIA